MKKFFLSCLAFAALSTSAFAQSSPFEWRVGEDTKIKLGGFVRVNINSDVDGNIAGNDFVSTAISESAYNNENRLNIDPSATRLSLQITQSTESLGDIKAYVEGDFRGAGYTVRLRQAYVEMAGFVAGQAWSFMSDLPSQAPTIDINGVGSRTFLRTYLVGYRRNFGKLLSAGISLELPTMKSDYPTGYGAVNQNVPNIPVYIQVKGDAGHLKLAVAFRTLQYGINGGVANGVQNDPSREHTLGIGEQLSGSLKITKALTLYGQGIYGTGINNFISDLAGQSVNLQPIGEADLEATPMGGASLGLSAKFAKKWSAAVSGSLTRNFGDKDYFAGKYKGSSYVAANIQYSPAPRLSVGAEYLNGTLSTFGDKDPIGAQRVSLSVKYSL